MIVLDRGKQKQAYYDGIIIVYHFLNNFVNKLLISLDRAVFSKGRLAMHKLTQDDVLKLYSPGNTQVASLSSNKTLNPIKFGSKFETDVRGLGGRRYEVRGIDVHI